MKTAARTPIRYVITGAILDVFNTEPWMAFGLCTRPGENPDDWFPKQAGDKKHSAASRHAMALCHACPVAADCLAYAVEYTAYPRLTGIWGGTNEGDRRRFARKVAPSKHLVQGRFYDRKRKESA
jgi:hypothetical protein